MLVLISYDVATTSAGGKSRLRRIAKACQNFGQRVQYSIFECVVDPTQWAQLRISLLNEYDPEVDSLRFYFLGSNFESKIEHHGAKPVRNLRDPLII